MPAATTEDPGRIGQSLIERLCGLPGGTELLELASEHHDVELIGGATRDLLLGLTPRELDVVVARDAPAFADALAGKLGAGAGPPEGSGTAVHERFGTALVWWPGGRVDVAARRAESYEAPGALPQVRAGTPAEDLRRRDFTVNTIALALGGPRRGEVRAAAHALEDLAAARLRVLHEQSFLDDPTRLLRMARYLARLGFQPEPRTLQLAARALASGALSSVSGARVGAELRLALAEPDPVAALATMGRLGMLSALHPRLEFDEPLARAALQILPEDGRPDVLLTAGLLLAMTRAPQDDPEQQMFGLLTALEFTSGDRDRVMRTALCAPLLPARLAAASVPSELREILQAVPLEALALAAAIDDARAPGDAGAAARRWLAELRHVRLVITGDDLLAAGVPAGPEIGRRLSRALDMRLDGELDETPEAQLRAALQAAV